MSVKYHKQRCHLLDSSHTQVLRPYAYSKEHAKWDAKSSIKNRSQKRRVASTSESWVTNCMNSSSSDLKSLKNMFVMAVNIPLTWNGIEYLWHSSSWAAVTASIWTERKLLLGNECRLTSLWWCTKADSMHWYCFTNLHNQTVCNSPIGRDVSVIALNPHFCVISLRLAS